MRRVIYPGLCLSLLLLLTACANGHQPSPYQAAMEQAYAPDQPGATAVVSREGEILFQGAAGLVHMELGLPLEAEHRLRLASVSKQYTAAAILKLADEGKLALDDPLERFLPDYPQGEVTVHQLLNHSSGIASYTSIPGYMMDERIRRDLGTHDLIQVFADREPDFEPGEDWLYNNSGYVLLGAIIEEISGKPWHEYIREALLSPAGINETGYFSHEEIVPGRVPGYQAGETVSNAPWISMSQPHAAGALYGSAMDVDRWQRRLHGGELLSDEHYQAMIRADEIATGVVNGDDYGYGLILGEWRDQDLIHHGGGIHGFNTYAMYLPESALSVVVLSNHAGHEPAPAIMARRLAAIALGEPYPVEKERIQVDPDRLDELVGTYEIEEGVIRTLRVDEEGRLISQRQGGRAFPVEAVSPDRFVFATSLSYFDVERDGDGQVVALRFHQQGAPDYERAEKVSDDILEPEAIELDEAQMERLTGLYQIQPGFTLRVFIHDGGLHAQATGQGPVPLEATTPSRLRNQQFGLELVFDLPEHGPADSLTLHQAGQEIPAPRIEE
ncbi:serine hydrolase [Gammaproteobacteria bacterium AB-CW1]|uniref:Serine hydrolase n=1 Tax=Natronospira elongata TaxID=3110268 RepID=A0AAP6JHG9_9GAMM|nr:serine hydrolase [Gammaproteobacteria bacterium AB-CW1]